MWDKEEGLKKGPAQSCGTRRKGLEKVSSSCVGQGGRALKRSCPDVWNKEVGLKKGLVQLSRTRRKGFKKVLSSCVGQLGRA